MAGIDHSTYYNRHHSQSAALIRARRPYLVRNAITGLAMLGVVAGIYTFTLNAVGQDEFEDVKVPDASSQAAQSTAASAKS